MLEETAIVIGKMKGQSPEELDVLKLQLQRESHCNGCGVSSYCGTALVAASVGKNLSTFHVPDTLGVEVGEYVVVGLPERGLIISALWVYLLPLIFMMVLPITIQSTMTVPEALVALSGLLGLGLGFGLTATYLNRYGDKRQLVPIIVRKMGLNAKPIKMFKQGGVHD